MNEPPPAYNGHQPPQPQHAQPVPMVAIQPNLSPTPSPAAGKARKCWRGLLITGYMQVVLGLISVLLGCLAIVFKAFMYPVGTPIWTGIGFYILTGILGIACSRKKANGLVVVYMIMCIITAVAGSAVCIAHAVAVTVGGFNGCPDSVRYEFEQRVGCSSPYASRAALNGMISVLGFIEMIVAIVGASFTCCNACRSSGTATQVVTYTTVSQQAVGHYVVAPQQQYGQPPQYGGGMYPVQQIAVAPPQGQFDPQAQGQPQHQLTPHTQAPPPEKLPLPDGV